MKYEAREVKDAELEAVAVGMVLQHEASHAAQKPGIDCAVMNIPFVSNSVLACWTTW